MFYTSSDETWTACNNYWWHLETSPNAEIVIVGDFNAHNDRWLPFSKVQKFSRTVYWNAVVNSVTQPSDAPTHFTRAIGRNNRLLDLFLTSYPHKYRINVGATLGNCDHATVSSAKFSYSTAPSNSITLN